MIQLSFADSAVQPIIIPLDSNYQFLGKDESGLAIFDIKNWTDGIVQKVEDLFPNQKVAYASGYNCEKYNLKYGSIDLGKIASVESLGNSNSIFERFIETKYKGQVHATQIRKQFIQKDEFGRFSLTTNGEFDANEVMPPQVVNYINTECQNVLGSLHHYCHSAKFVT